METNWQQLQGQKVEVCLKNGQKFRGRLEAGEWLEVREGLDREWPLLEEGSLTFTFFKISPAWQTRLERTFNFSFSAFLTVGGLILLAKVGKIWMYLCVFFFYLSLLSYGVLSRTKSERCRIRLNKIAKIVSLER